jgi:hypothetical protein
MARSGKSTSRRAPHAKAELPAPLPPELRTVGQLVAESIRVYGHRFLMCLLLSVPVVVTDQLLIHRHYVASALIYLAFSPVFTAAYVLASVIVTGGRPTRRNMLMALLLGTLVFVPAAVALPGLSIGSVIWLALVGLVVPAAIVEGGSPGSLLRRGYALGRVDYVHAVGSLATLVLILAATRPPLWTVLRLEGGASGRVAFVLADIALTPIVFLGAAVLYVDQAARLGSPRPRSRRSDAHLPDADDAHGEGRPDAQLQSGAPS